MEGSKTCEDGIVLTYTCENCGDTYSKTYYGHYNQDKVLDLSEYGVCKSHNVRVYGCVCCDNVEWLNGYNYMYSEETKDGHIARCYDCGLTITEIRARGEKDDNCNRHINETVIVSCKGTEILTIIN